MRLPTLTITALPFILLAAMLVSIVVAPRLQSNTTSHNVDLVSQPVTQLATVVVNAPTTAVNARSDKLADQWQQSAISNCAWTGSELRMPYFSFAKPILTTRGI